MLFNVVTGCIGAFEFVNWHCKDLNSKSRWAGRPADHWNMPPFRAPRRKFVREGQSVKQEVTVGREIFAGKPLSWPLCDRCWQRRDTHAKPRNDDTFVEGGDLASTERDERQVHAGVGYSAP